MGLGNTLKQAFNNRCERIKILNLKKQENEEIIEKYNKLICLEK